MGRHLTVEVLYGVKIYDRGYGEPEFPWGDSDPEEWWRQLRGFDPADDPYADPEFPTGLNTLRDTPEPWKSRLAAYWEARDAFDAEHPMPFELEVLGVADYPHGWVLRVPGDRGRQDLGSGEPAGAYRVPNETPLGPELEAFLEVLVKIDAAAPGLSHSKPGWWICGSYG